VWSVFEQPAGSGANHFVGQVERMHASRCYRASQGRLGCISCHDPHYQPAAAERVSYYRERCLECHADQACGLPVGDIVHTAATNHRIPRRADAADESRIDHEEPPAGEPPLVLFHRALMNEGERAEAERDLGVALCEGEPKLGTAALALPLLESALRARPDDVVAWESKGTALGWLGRAQDGLTAFQAALARDPGRESTLARAALLAAEARRSDDAIAFWRRAITISPWRAEYRTALASLSFQAHDYSAAAAACRDALGLNPADIPTRMLLVRCDLHLGNRAAARDEFQTLMALDPPFREELLRWFAPLVTPQ
jgi:tetratricopeptide (TPR) repeat protein